MPELSVVMPAHNAEAYIDEALGSVLAQTLSDLEVVVVDDSSTDRTPEILARYAASDARVRVVNTDARNAAKARNVGMQAVRGRWIAFMDADDIAYPRRLERQLEAAKRVPEAVVWGTYMRRITFEGLPMDEVRVGSATVEEFEALDRSRSLVRCYGAVAMVRTDVVKLVGGFDRRFEPLEDAEMWDRMAMHGPVLVVPEVLQDYRQHDRSLSVQKIGLQRKLFRYLTQRYTARLRGETLELEAFDLSEARRSPWLKLDDALRGRSQIHGRRYHIAKARGQRWVALQEAVLSVATHPGRFIARLGPDAPHI